MANQRFTPQGSHGTQGSSGPGAGMYQGGNPGDKKEAGNSGATGVLETAKEKAQDIAATAKEKAQDIASSATEFAGRAKDTAQEWASSAADAAGRAGETVREAAGTAVEKVEDFGATLTSLIRRYPLESMLVGLGVGFLISQAVRKS